MFKSRSKKKRKSPLSLKSRQLAAAEGAGKGMLLRGRVASSGVILHQPPQGMFKEGSEATALEWQAGLLKLVCGCNNFVFIGARKLLQFSLGSVSFVVLFLFYSFGKG